VSQYDSSTLSITYTYSSASDSMQSFSNTVAAERLASRVSDIDGVSSPAPGGVTVSVAHCSSSSRVPR
jgi:hypothetical protein